MAEESKPTEAKPASPPPAEDLKNLEKELGPSPGEKMKSVLSGLKGRKTIWLELPQVFKGVASKDEPTQNMSLVFILSLLGLLLVIGVSFQRYSKTKQVRALVQIQRQHRAKTAELEKLSQANKAKANVVTLGTFEVQLRPPTHDKLAVGTMGTAELEIVLACDDPDTRDYIEANIIQAKSQVTNFLTVMDHDELMTREGKNKLKQILIHRLNGWLPQGKVENVFFAKLIVD